MKQEPALYWCLFHSSLNAKLKVITSNWLNLKPVLQEPQKVQMRTTEPRLLICSASESTLNSLIFQEKKIDRTYVRMNDFFLWCFDLIRLAWERELLKGQDKVRTAKGQREGNFESEIIENNLARVQSWLPCSLSPTCVSLTDSVQLYMLQREVRQQAGKGQALNADSASVHPGKRMEMKC